MCVCVCVCVCVYVNIQNYDDNLGLLVNLHSYVRNTNNVSW